jgi:hypothetical protein
MKSGTLPRLWFDLTSIELPGGCAGSIDAEVSADLEPSKMTSTGTLIRQPDFVIWSSKNSLSAPFREFSSFAIQTSEQMMKKFVNDWTASQ